jgi:hypothetical protein
MAEKKQAAKDVKNGAASKEEQVGYHKGSLATLSKERQELARILGIVEQLMQMHVSGLKELGVDLEAEAEKLMGDQAPANPSGKGPSKPKNKPPIEDIL